MRKIHSVFSQPVISIFQISLGRNFSFTQKIMKWKKLLRWQIFDCKLTLTEVRMSYMLSNHFFRRCSQPFQCQLSQRTELYQRVEAISWSQGEQNVDTLSMQLVCERKFNLILFDVSSCLRNFLQGNSSAWLHSFNLSSFANLTLSRFISQNFHQPQQIFRAGYVAHRWHSPQNLTKNIFPHHRIRWCGGNALLYRNDTSGSDVHCRCGGNCSGLCPIHI